MGSPFLEAGVTSAFLIISGNVLVLIQLLKKKLIFHNRQKKIPRVLILERHLTFFISRKFLHEI